MSKIILINLNPRDKNAFDKNDKFMFHIFFQDFIGTYIAQPGLSQMLSKTQQSMTHAVEVMVDIQQSHQSTTQLQSQRTEESISPDA